MNDTVVQLTYAFEGLRLDAHWRASRAPGGKLRMAPDYFGSGSSLSGRAYDLSLDGSRFLMIKQQATGEAPALVVVLNWFEELKRLVPAG